MEDDYKKIVNQMFDLKEEPNISFFEILLITENVIQEFYVDDTKLLFYCILNQS